MVEMRIGDVVGVEAESPETGAGAWTFGHVGGRCSAESGLTDSSLGELLCFLHPSMYKGDHPRFCFERLEYIGSKIQDVVMAERLLIKQLDAPNAWLQKLHRGYLLNKICGRRLRIKRLHNFIMYGEARQEKFDKCRRLRNFCHSGVQQAIHGLGYVVYGKSEVRRLMFDVFEVEQPLPKEADFNDTGRRYVDTLQPTY